MTTKFDVLKREVNLQSQEKWDILHFSIYTILKLQMDQVRSCSKKENTMNKLQNQGRNKWNERRNQRNPKKGRQREVTIKWEILAINRSRNTKTSFWKGKKNYARPKNNKSPTNWKNKDNQILVRKIYHTNKHTRTSAQTYTSFQEGKKELWTKCNAKNLTHTQQI